MTRADPIRAALERLIEALDDYEPTWGCFPESALADARAALAEQQALSESQRYLLPLGWGHQPAPPAEGEVAELVTLLAVGADCSGGAKLSPDQCHRAAELLEQQQAKIETLEQQLETERMRVVACGIIAMSDTPLSAVKNRNCHPDYWSASADDIARQIDELMRLRAQQTPVPVSEEPWKRKGWCDERGRCWLQGKVEGDWRLLDPVNGAPQLKYCFNRSLPATALPLPQGEVE